MSGRPHSPTAQIVWFDPGVTTGVAVLALDPEWLTGKGDASWDGLKRAIRASWFAEIGIEAKEWEEGRSAKGLMTDYLPEAKYCGPKISTEARNELNTIADAREILAYWPSACWGYETYRVESMAAATNEALTPMRFYSTLAFGTIMDDGRPRIPFQQDRSMKFTANNDRMKSAGLYMPGMRHATDAARHAAVFARAARQKRAVREQAWPRLFDETVRARIETERAKRKGSK